MLIFAIDIIRRALRRAVPDRDGELAMFKSAVDMASDQIVITDPEGTVIYANRAVEAVTGYRPEEVIGQKAGSRALWGGHMEEAVYRRLWQTIRSGRPYIGEFRNRRKDGRFYEAEARIYPIIGRGGKIRYFAGIEMDISARKQVERSKSEFVSLASHQLRTPLAGISLALDVLARGVEGELNPRQKKAILETGRDVRQAADLVQALLDLSRIEMGSFRPEPEPVEIRRLARSAVAENKARMAEKNIRLVEDIDIEQAVVMLDQTAAKLVLQNLLSNAVKYNVQNGEIRLSIRQSGNKLAIEVADTGLGIPSDEQAQIFSKFYRASNGKKAVSDGTGLGLSLIKPIIEALGGSIGFSSQENRGTVFRVVLPVEATRT